MTTAGNHPRPPGDSDPPAGCRDRFLVDSEDTGRTVLGGRTPAGSALHSRTPAPALPGGRVQPRPPRQGLGSVLGDEEHVAEVGDLVFKPRGEWHTFFNAPDEPARLLELISPGGLEEPFRPSAPPTWTRPRPCRRALRPPGRPRSHQPIVREDRLTFG